MYGRSSSITEQAPYDNKCVFRIPVDDIDFFDVNTLGVKHLLTKTLIEQSMKLVQLLYDLQKEISGLQKVQFRVGRRPKEDCELNYEKGRSRESLFQRRL